MAGNAGTSTSGTRSRTGSSAGVLPTTGETIEQMIVRVANELGVDPLLALAIAQQESGFDPNIIGDNGHSVGLYQLHDQGHGYGMSVEERQDPEVNARNALTVVARVASENPGLTPGQIAAKAQRPYDAVGYARSVDAIYSGGITTGGRVALSATSGGTNTQYVGGQMAPLPEVDPRTYAQQTYGYLAAYLDDPEIGPIILQAAKEGWDSNRLQGALYATNWWKTHSDSARTWDALAITDPATARRRIDEMRVSITNQATQMGVSMTAERAAEFAEAALRSGWSAETLRLAISSEAKWQGPGTIMGGDIGALQVQMQALAADYMVPISDETAFWWAQQIAQGSRTIDGAKAAFTSLAIGRFPQLADLINQGITPGDYFDPYKELIARTLEVGPDSINLLDDPRWMQVTGFNDGGKIRPMTLGEAAKLARQQPEWTNTMSAKAQSADLTTQLLETFGRIDF